MSPASAMHRYARPRPGRSKGRPTRPPFLFVPLHRGVASACNARSSFSATDDLWPQRREIRLARRGAARQRARPDRCGRASAARAKRSKLTRSSRSLDIERRLAAAASRRSRSPPSASRSRGWWRRSLPASRRVRRAERQRLVAQAVALLEQDQPLLIDVVDARRARVSQAADRSPAPRAGTDRRTARMRLDLGARRPAAPACTTSSAPRVELLDQHRRLRLAQLQPQVRDSAAAAPAGFAAAHRARATG